MAAAVGFCFPGDGAFVRFRAFVFGALGLYVAWGGPLPAWTAWLMPLIALMVCLTTANRIRRALAEAAAQAHPPKKT